MHTPGADGSYTGKINIKNLNQFLVLTSALTVLSVIVIAFMFMSLSFLDRF